MRFLYPAAITNVTLTSSTVPETDHPAWDTLTTYVAGTRRIYNHAIYEALAGSTGAQPDISPLAWLLIGPTNRWAMFDLTRGTRTTATAEITVVLLLTDIDSLSLLDVTGTGILVDVRTSAGTLVYSRTVVLSGLSSLYLADLPPSAGAAVKVSVTGPGAVSIGSLQLGAMYEMGDTTYGLGLGIIDYSVKKVDEFGDVTLVRRNFSRRMSARVCVPAERVDECVRLLAGIRATPVVWIGARNYVSTFVLGYYRDWSIDVTYNLVSDCTLTIEGMAESDDFTLETVAGVGGGGGGGGGSSGQTTCIIGYSGGVVSTTGGVVTAAPAAGLLMHFDGNYTDSIRGRAFAPQPASFVAGLATFGQALDMSGADISTSADLADFGFGTGDFTVECFMRPAGPFAVNGTICRLRDSALAQIWAFGLRLDESYTRPFFSASGSIVELPFGQSMTLDAWAHVAFVRASGVLTLYIGGISRASAAFPVDLVSDIAGDFAMFGVSSLVIDELRICRSAKYTGTFTPPSAPFTGV